MKKDEVKIGAVYEVRLHGVLTRVRIEEAFTTRHWVGMASSGKRQSRTHWSATNLRTGRAIQIKSAAKLRREVLDKPERVAEPPKPPDGQEVTYVAVGPG